MYFSGCCKRLLLRMYVPLWTVYANVGDEGCIYLLLQVQRDVLLIISNILGTEPEELLIGQQNARSSTRLDNIQGH